MGIKRDIGTSNSLTSELNMHLSNGATPSLWLKLPGVRSPDVWVVMHPKRIPADECVFWNRDRSPEKGGFESDTVD